MNTSFSINTITQIPSIVMDDELGNNVKLGVCIGLMFLFTTPILYFIVWKEYFKDSKHYEKLLNKLKCFRKKNNEELIPLNNI